MLLKEPTKSINYLIIPVLCAFTLMITMACTFEMGRVEELFSEESPVVEKKKLAREIFVAELLSNREIIQKQEEFIYPVEGEVVSAYGYRIHPLEKVRKMHLGVDFRATIGTPVKAIADGEVILVVRSNAGYGNHIEVRHGSTGFVSQYAQLGEIKVEKGQKMKQGDIIATTGNSGASTGPHLHFEIIKDGKKVNPEEYLKK